MVHVHEAKVEDQDLKTGPVWIGVVGAAKAGKTTFANVMSDIYNTKEPYLAAPIKTIAQKYYGMSREDCYTHEGKSKMHPYIEFDDGTQMTNRQVLEQIGDKLQEIDPLVLLRSAGSRSTETPMRETLDAVIFPDLRTKTQENFIKDKGGIVVYVQRDEAEQKTEAFEDPHHTKTFYKRADPDIVIHNNDSKEEFERFVTASFGSVWMRQALFPHRVTFHS